MKLPSIGIKLFIAGAFSILLTAAAISVLGYRQARRTIVAEAERHVYALASERSARLDAFLKERRSTIESILGNASSSDLGGEGFSSTQSLIENLPWVLDIGILSDSSDRSIPLIQNAWGGKYAYGSVQLNKAGEPAFLLACPLPSKTSEITNVLLIEHSARGTIDPIMMDSVGLGSSGEAFLVDKDMVMLTPSRFHQHPARLTHKMPIPPVLKGIEGGSGSMIYQGFLDFGNRNGYRRSAFWITDDRLEHAGSRYGGTDRHAGYCVAAFPCLDTAPERCFCRQPKSSRWGL
jgi:hypothetical protein